MHHASDMVFKALSSGARFVFNEGLVLSLLSHLPDGSTGCSESQTRLLEWIDSKGCGSLRNCIYLTRLNWFNSY